jgi:hypothetical protein
VNARQQRPPARAGWRRPNDQLGFNSYVNDGALVLQLPAIRFSGSFPDALTLLSRVRGSRGAGPTP